MHPALDIMHDSTYRKIHIPCWSLKDHTLVRQVHDSSLNRPMHPKISISRVTWPGSHIGFKVKSWVQNSVGSIGTS